MSVPSLSPLHVRWRGFLERLETSWWAAWTWVLIATGDMGGNEDEGASWRERTEQMVGEGEGAADQATQPCQLKSVRLRASIGRDGDLGLVGPVLHFAALTSWTRSSTPARHDIFLLSDTRHLVHHLQPCLLLCPSRFDFLYSTQTRPRS